MATFCHVRHISRGRYVILQLRFFPAAAFDTIQRTLQSFIETRPFEQDFRSDRAFDLVREKIDSCNSEHNTCHASRRHTLPARIYVGSFGDTCRLVETAEKVELYTVLSYCWGMPKRPVMTTDAPSMYRNMPCLRSSYQPLSSMRYA